MPLRSQTSPAIAPRPHHRRGTAASALVQRRIGQFSQHLRSALGPDMLSPRPSLRLPADQAEIERLTASAVAGDREFLSATVNQKRRLGESDQHICLVLLTAIAQRLGEWWEEDRCGFVEVTLGMLLLHQTLRELAPGLRRGRIGHPGRSALMVPMPGEQHCFGIGMVAEFFRAAGWQVCQDGGRGLHGLTRRVGAEWFGVVALSYGVEERLSELPAAIEAIRAHSFNPDAAVMVGGAALAGNPALASACGAAATAADAAEALHRAEQLVGLMVLSL